MVRYDSLDVDYPATPLSDKEAAKLHAQIDNLFGPKDGVIYELLQTYKDHIKGFVEVVKHALGDPIFGGMVAADTEIGIAPIRPAHLTLTSGATAYGERIRVTFNTNWKTIAEGSMDDDEGIILFGIIDFYDGNNVTARVDGIRLTVGQRAMLPIDVSNAVIKDNRNGVPVWNFNSVPIIPKEYYKIEVHSPDADSQNPKTGEIKLVGLTVARGRFLKANF